MKQIVIALAAAVVLLSGCATNKSHKEHQTAACCKEGAACCGPGKACCADHS